MSLSGDSELRIQEGYNGKPVVGLVAGSWGKRLVRNLSSPFREAEKSQEYLDTKKAVLATLVKIYREELGTRVFRANIGRMQDGVHVVSGYHPITGRHIRQMMEQADQELLRKFADPELGGRRLGRDDTSGPRAPESTRNWMNEQYFGEQDREDDVRVELRSSKVEIKDRPRRDTWGEVAKALQEDLRNRTEQGEKRLFWTLDIGLGGDRGFLMKHPIGIHVDVDQPEQVHVYDGNVRMVTVTREEFAAWLAAHMKHEYKVGTVELHRALPMRNSCFEQKDGVWKREREHTFDGKEIGDWLLENIKKMDLEPELNTC